MISRLCLVRCEKGVECPPLPLYSLSSWDPSSSRSFDGARGRNRSGSCSEETCGGKKPREKPVRAILVVLARHGSSVLRDHGDRVPSVRRSRPPRRRPGPTESPADRGALRAEPVVLRVRAEGHLAAHAQDRRRLDDGGERRRVSLLSPRVVRRASALIPRPAVGSGQFRETPVRGNG